MTYISWSKDFVLYLEDFLMCNHYLGLSGIISQYDSKFNLKINVDHCDIYFMVQ